jgi:hypothetical protein
VVNILDKREKENPFYQAQVKGVFIFTKSYCVIKISLKILFCKWAGKIHSALRQQTARPKGKYGFVVDCRLIIKSKICSPLGFGGGCKERGTATHLTYGQIFDLQKRKAIKLETKT